MNAAIRRLLAPIVIAAIVSTGGTVATNYFIEHGKEAEDARSQRQIFTALLTQRILDKTQSLFVPKGLTEVQLADADQSRASVTLLALEGLAETEDEQRALLLVAAKLLNANPKYPDTGGPAARFLDTDIGSIEAPHANEWTDGDRSMQKDLTDFVHSDAFVDLVSAGFVRSYYDVARGSMTLPNGEGDAEVSSTVTARLLSLIGKKPIDGWSHIASWKVSGQPIRLDRYFSQHATAVINRANARDGKLLGAIIYDYVDPPELANKLLLTSNAAQPSFVLMKPRLLRDHAPVTAVLPSDPISHGIAANDRLEGPLGRVVGIVDALECVSVVETVPVIVFSGNARGERVTPLIHLWAHVQSSEHCSGAISASE